MLSAGDLPISALADEWGFGRGVMYPDWLRWSRGGEMGSALMLTWRLVLMERWGLSHLYRRMGQREEGVLRL